MYEPVLVSKHFSLVSPVYPGPMLSELRLQLSAESFRPCEKLCIIQGISFKLIFSGIILYQSKVIPIKDIKISTKLLSVQTT